MTLKERLDVVWNDPHICCPNHLVSWNEKNKGYSYFGELGLWYTKGLKLPQRTKRKLKIIKERC